MKTKSKVVDNDAKRNPVTPTYLPESVTIYSLIEDLSGFCTSEDLVIALNSLIQEAELSTHFVNTRRRNLQIVMNLFHDILAVGFGSNTALMMTRLFEREWAKPIDFSTNELLQSLDRVIEEFAISGVNTDPQDLKELSIVRELRNRLITDHLGRETMELSASLLA